MDYILTIGTIVLAVVYWGFANIKDVITERQRNTMVISTVLLMLLIGYGRKRLTGGDDQSMSTGLLGMLYLNWYFWSTLFANILTPTNQPNLDDIFI